MLSLKNFFLLFFALLFLFSLTSYAHKINLFTNQVGNKLEGEAFFADGSPCVNCEIKVLDLKGKEILKEKTDELGKFSLTIPEGFSEIRILLSAGEGHLIEKKITLKISSQKRELSRAQNQNTTLYSKPEIKIDKEVYKEIDERFTQLEEEVKALRAEIGDMRKEMQKISYRDIIGSIGYILGVFAIIYFIKKNTIKKDAS